MAAINRDASRFLTLVSEQFDRRYFAGIATLPVYKPGAALFSPPSQMAKLPIEIQAMVHNQAANFSHWVQASRFLDAPLRNANDERRRKLAIEQSAYNLLLRLGKPIGRIQFYSEQLLTHVFQDAFTRVDGDTRPDDREEIINLSIRLQPALDNLPLTFRRLKYKGEFVAAGILNHTGGKIALTYLTYRVAQWAQPQIFSLFSQTVIPKAVNFLINNCHVHVIYVVSGGVALVQFAYFHYWKATFTFYAAKIVSGSIHPLAHRVVVVVESVAFFPGRAIEWLMMGPISLLTNSWRIHSALAANLNANKDRTRAEFLEHGGMKAYRAWMELMQEGVKAHLVPNQPVDARAD
jgi:hypothetical protein